ncbi:hypothetical protein CUT44_22235 [Streptomyces carminius]|uniref:Uncharacterized protein n=1 Tax=Streptomyces carminius TaxID=2665496 RepID=A0A2M8LUQ1_9ACTN|nr:DUF6479 family protein [Streptomyces carminius]PJE95682.1 hypothetical protein CUT44_22235 [Streptomyces carminius]
MNGTYGTYAAGDALPVALELPLEGLGAAIPGIIVAGGLVLAVVYGLRLLKRGDEGISTPSERPEHPRGYEDGVREDDPIPTDGRRRYPHELQEHEDTHPCDPNERPTWSPGSSGGFGSGGPGRT